MGKATPDRIYRPMWFDIPPAHARIFHWVLIGMLGLGVLFAMEWGSIAKAVYTTWIWSGLVCSWWVAAILRGQWHGWRARVVEGTFIVAYLVAIAGMAAWITRDALADIENWDWVLARVLWERNLYLTLAVKFAKQAILAGFVLLALVAAVPPLLWRRPKLASFLPEVPVFQWRTMRETPYRTFRPVTSRLWIVNGMWLEIACWHDDRAGIVVEQWTRWFALLPALVVVMWHGGYPAWHSLVLAAVTYVVLRKWELKSADETWPWPRRSIGRLSDLDAITLEPLATFYSQPPETAPKRGFTLVAHFSDGRLERISTTDHAASDLQEVHARLTRELIEKRAEYLAAARRDAPAAEAERVIEI